MIKVKLAQLPTVIQAPPSQKAAYPAMAILVDKADIDITNDDEDLQFDPTLTPNDPGYILTGGYRTDQHTNDYLTGTTYMIDQDTTVSQIGTIHMTCRLWAAARTPAQQEQLEQELLLAFYATREAPGRLMVPIGDVVVADVSVPFGIATAVIDDKLQWNSEFAFAERQWTWISLTIDAPMLVPRYDPIASRLLLVVSDDLQTAVNSSSDLDKLTDAQTFEVQQDGTVTGVA